MDDMIAEIDRLLTEAEDHLRKAKQVRDIMRRAGKDTSSIDREIAEYEAEISRWRIAISSE